MKTRLLFAAAAVIALSGCASTATTTAYQDAEKALIAAHDLHAAAADALVVAAPAMSSTVKAQAKSYLDQSEAILVQADSLTDAPSILADVSQATTLINNAKGLAQ